MVTNLSSSVNQKNITNCNSLCVKSAIVYIDLITKAVHLHDEKGSISNKIIGTQIDEQTLLIKNNKWRIIYNPDKETPNKKYIIALIAKTDTLKKI